MRRNLNVTMLVCAFMCLFLKGGSVQPSLHHHVHQRVSPTPLSCAGCNKEVHPGHGTARGLHSTTGWEGKDSTSFVKSFLGFPSSQQGIETPDQLVGQVVIKLETVTVSVCYSSQGAICLVSIYGTHHHPAVWTDPHVRHEMEKSLLSLWHNVVVFEQCDLLSFRSFFLCVLTLQTQRDGLLMPSSPFPQAPGTVYSSI